MTEKEVLRKLNVARNGISCRPNKNIATDENNMESYSDYFTERSTNESIQPTPKEKSKVNESERDRISLPSFALSTSNRSNMTSVSKRVTRSSKRASNVEVINAELDKSCNNLDHGSSIPEGFDEKIESCSRNFGGLPELLHDEIPDTNDDSAASREEITIGNELVDSSCRPTNVNDLDEVSRDDHQTIEHDQATSERNDDIPSHALSQDPSSGTSRSTSITKKKRKKKKKCDLFTDRKVRKRSSSSSSSIPPTENLQGDLSVSPILLASERVDFAASTPAVYRCPRMIYSATSISEMASPNFAAPETPAVDVPCLGHMSSAPSDESQIIAPRARVTRKSVTFNEVTMKHSGNEVTIGTSSNSTKLPSFSSAEQLHYFETTIKKNTPNKRKIIIPNDGDDNDGLRRSKRKRVEKLDWYKDERVEYKWDGFGWTMDRITTPQKSPKQIHKYVKRIAKKADRDKRKEKGELSVHVPINENLMRADSSLVEIFDNKTQKLVHKRCIFKYNQCDKRSCTTKLAATDDDPLVMSKTINLSGSVCSHVEIRPLQAKTLQQIKDNNIVFFIHKGKVEVTIHESSFIVETRDMFHVRPGNVYGIKNLRNEVAHLIFFRTKDHN